MFAVEARNENALYVQISLSLYLFLNNFTHVNSRSIIRPTVQGLLDGISRGITLKLAQQAASNTNITALLQNSPQTVTQPVSYRIINIVPFDQTVCVFFCFFMRFFLLTSAFQCFGCHIRRVDLPANPIVFHCGM